MNDIEITQEAKPIVVAQATLFSTERKGLGMHVCNNGQTVRVYETESMRTILEADVEKVVEIYKLLQESKSFWAPRNSYLY